MKEGTSAVPSQSGLDKEWWADSMDCHCYLRNIQDLVSDGKSPYERRFGMPFNGPVIPFGAMVEYHPISAKDKSRLHQFGRKVSPGIFLGYVLYAGENLDAKEVSTPMKGDNFIFPAADGTVIISGGDQRPRTSTLIRDRPERGEEQEVLRGESDGLSSPTPLQDDSTLDDAEARNDFWSGNLKNRHHVDIRGKLYVPREESFPNPMKYIDVTRNTHTSLDVMMEKNIDDYWNVDEERE